MRKCKMQDCDRSIEDQYTYCSIECACYGGVFSVTKGELMRWRKNDAAMIGSEVFRVIEVTQNNLPVVRRYGVITRAQQPDEWDNVGTYTWNWNPFKPGWNYIPTK